MPPKSIPLTWRNVSAPSGAGALNAFNKSGENLGNAISGIGDALQTGSQDFADAETADFLNDLNAERDPAARQAMIDASQAFLDMEQVNTAQKANVVEDRASTNFANAQTAFANQQTTFAQGQTDRGLELTDAATARVTRKENQTIKRQRHNLVLKAEHDKSNLSNRFLGKPDTPAPAYLTANNQLPAAAPVGAQPGTADRVAAATRAAATRKVLANINDPAPSAKSPEDQFVSNLVFAETGIDGAIASKNLNSSASGTYQVINANLKTPPYGIEPQRTGESTAVAKERIGEAMARGAYQEYGNIPQAAAAHRFGDGVAQNWDGRPETLDAAVRQHGNLTKSQADKALGGWDNYLSKVQGGSPVDQAKQTFAPRPTVANPRIYGDVSVLKDADDYEKIVEERSNAIQAHAKWAILDKNKLTPETLGDKTPVELRKIWIDAQKYMPKRLDQDEGSKALIDAMALIVDTSNLGSKKAAQEATIFDAKLTFSRRIQADGFNPLAAKPVEISKRTGIPVDEVNAMLTPKQVPALLDKFISRMRDNEKFGTSNQHGAFTVDPDSGVEEYNRAMTEFKKDYSHIAKSQWTDLETDAKALLSIKAATDKAAIKRKNTRALETKRVEYINELNNTKEKLATTHNIHSVYKAFPDIRDGAIDDAVKILQDKVIFPNVGPSKGSIPMKKTDKKWILHEAMKLVGRTNQNYLLPNTFETGSNTVADRWEKTIIEDVQDSVDILVIAYAKPNGRAVVNGNNIKLLGSVLDIPQYDTASK